MKYVITQNRGLFNNKPPFLLLCFFIFLAPGLHAQNVSINNTGAAANASSMLDVSSTTKGLLIPRMLLAERTAMNPLPAIAQGLMVYQTDGVQGFYYNTSLTTTPNWIYVFGSNSAWSLTGNAGTTVGTNFIGTTDAQPLTFKVNNEKAGRIYSMGMTFLGYQAGNSNTSNSSTGFGCQALYLNTTGNYNTANGNYSLYSNTTGYNNTANGFQTLLSNTEGFFNTAIGGAALFSNSTGYSNAANGFQTLYSNISGSENTASGMQALNFNTTGSYNTANGYAALFRNVAGSNATAIGYKAMYYANNTAIPFTNYNVALGYEALRGSTNASANTGNWNTALGSQTLFSNTSGNFNTAAGNAALFYNTTGIFNTATGINALHNNTDGGSNTANGANALFYNTSGGQNTANGYLALWSNITGYNNTAIGYDALRENLDNNNTAAGYQALRNNTSGWQNTAVGSSSLVSNITGSYNTAVGYNTGPNSTAYSNTTCLGIDATATGSGMVRIGNIFVGSIGGYQNWTNISDGRFKQNVKEDVPGLSFVMKLRPVTYTLDVEGINRSLGIKEDTIHSSPLGSGSASGAVHSGFIAQEVEKAAKGIGYNFSGVDAPKNEKDNYGLRYAEFVVPLVKAVQELNEQLKSEVGRLKSENDKLVKRIEKLEVLLGARVK